MKLSTILLSLSCAVPLSALSQATEEAPTGYTLVWSDEFDGTELNERTWNIEVSGTGGGNQELQYYRRENVSVTDGKLVLTARRESYQGKSFTSGRVNSKMGAAFKHGFIQARVKMPKTKDGLWPAYWMMGNDIDRYGWPRCGEIDIVEMGHFNAITGQYAGMQDRYFAGTTHYGPDATNENHQQYSQDFLAPEDNAVLNDEYHIFSMEWDDNYLYMYYDLDGYTNAKKRKARYFTQEIAYSDAPLAPGHYFQKPFFFLFNLAVGGTYTNIYDPAMITALPGAGDEAKMYVDWVRVYQKENDSESQYLYYDSNGQKVTNIPDEPEPEPQEDTKTQLSSFATQALADGVSTFDFDDAFDVVLISTSQGVTGNFQSRQVVLKDYNVDEDRNFLYVWDGTYAAQGREGKENSFGWGEGYTTYYVGSVGWSGLGFASPNGKGKDLSMLGDDYWLHFAMKDNAPERHASHTVIVGDAQFIIGESNNTLASVGDFKRDGQWYYFDIPLKALRQFSDPLFPASQVNAYEGNVFALMSGGVTDTELTFDNIFFYKSKSKELPTYTDKHANLGKYGYKSVSELGVSAFDFSQCAEVIPLALTEDVWNQLTGDGQYPEGSLVKAEHDYTMQGGHNNFFVWGDPQTFRSRQEGENVANSTGIYTGPVTSWASATTSGWNGMGYASIDGMGFTPAPKDLSMIDDSYYLHFALRSDAAVSHVPMALRLGSDNKDAIITLGSYSSRPVVGDFPRDGEWYAFDIPVAEMKRYGQLWSQAGNNAADGPITAFKGYVLCLYTMPTMYSGSYFSFDNIFFWKKADGTKPEVSELGLFCRKSLDDEGKSYFDFSGKDFAIVNVGAAELNEMRREGDDRVVADYSIDDSKTHLWLWEGTYETGTQSESIHNSFGNQEGWIDLVVADKGWTGAGLVSDDGFDVSMIDSNWYLHFATRGTDQSDLHLILAKSHFTIGASAHVNDYGELYPVLGNFHRDGEWYSYDIPMSEFFAINSSLFCEGTSYPACFKDNLFVFSNGGHQGDELQIDNLFFWREHQDDTGIGRVQPDYQFSTRRSQLKDGIYDMNGRRVGSAQSKSQLKKGIYVVRTEKGTKKIVVK